MLLAAIAAVAVVVVVLIVSGGGDDGSNKASGNARGAVATVQAFEQAISDRDYAKICSQLFTTEAQEASGGGNCQSVLAQNAARIRNPKIRITSVVLRGNAASVAVVAQVSGGPAVGDTIRLVRQGKGGYRISSAGAASAPGDS